VINDHAVVGNDGGEENGNSVTDDHVIAGNDGGEENSVTGDHTVARNGSSKENDSDVTDNRDGIKMLQPGNKLSEQTGSSSSPEGSNVSETSDTQALKNNVPAASNPAADQSKSIDSVMVAEVPKVDSAASSVTEAKTPAKKEKKIYPQLYFVLSPSLSFQKLTPMRPDQCKGNAVAGDPVGRPFRHLLRSGISAADRQTLRDVCRPFILSSEANPYL
jgi:hypothetical protein